MGFRNLFVQRSLVEQTLRWGTTPAISLNCPRDLEVLGARMVTADLIELLVSSKDFLDGVEPPLTLDLTFRRTGNADDLAEKVMAALLRRARGHAEQLAARGLEQRHCPGKPWWDAAHEEVLELCRAALEPGPPARQHVG